MPPTLRLLIVDDSARDTTLLCEHVQREGTDIVFTRVETAVELLTELDQQQWDLVISEYRLPSFNALAVLNLLRQRHLDLPLLLVSGRIGEEAVEVCVQHGAVGHIFKDQLDRLEQLIDQALADCAVRSLQRRRLTLYRSLAETAPDATILTDMHTTVVLGNMRAADLYRYDGPAMLEGLPVLTLVVAEECPRFLEDLHTGALAGRNDTHRYTGRRFDGTTFPLEVGATLLQAADGQPEGIMLAMRDSGAPLWVADSTLCTPGATAPPPFLRALSTVSHALRASITAGTGLI